MKRNPLLRSTLLVLVCLLSAGSLWPNHEAMAQEGATGGSLQSLDSQGNPAGQCPLKHTDVKAEITGFLARVIVTQQFENPFADKIEAVYTFPLPQAAAVDDMTIVVGDHTVKGKIMRREDAQATYDAARETGKVAAILHQQRPNVFTQAVANILPGQRIIVTISYVETLKYEAGSYEWTFPMVVAPRYTPAADPVAGEPAAAPANTTTQATDETVSERAAASAQNSEPVIPEGMRAGHDVSIEVNIDAGVPLVNFQSKTHEIEALQPGVDKAIVRLKDQATIPNHDFVLRYDVAGSQIEDALLTHSDERGGFFTLILQPPQRVTAADTTPKELVFVLDTSGSMSGSPIEMAKKAMMLALDSLYPQDTFNLILFSGDTSILFPTPVPATPDNVARAKSLLAGANGNGGTEMMKAIRAALVPSDAQDHLRIACFMTDGQVGNDMEIIAEVKKHPKARVFAMGFGSSPNRFLLDNITQYGRGEVEYVAGDNTGVAKRFHERVRNPLLTDISIDWGGLPVTDVYPKAIPDLFGAQPVIVSGRYTGSGKGIVRLRGKMSGSEFIREISVELPEQETQHDVLATLWARRKVDDLLAQDMNGPESTKSKTEITKLGLAYRMMTQFTSFVAVDEKAMTDGLEPRRVEVATETPVMTANGSFSQGLNPRSISELVTVSASSSMLSTSTETSIASTTQTRGLPIGGRNFVGYVLLVPGSVLPGSPDLTSTTRANVSVNGQRPSSNEFTVDGVSGNFGISPGGQSPGASATGSTQPLTATGGTEPLGSVNATQELTIRAYGLSAEYGRNSGAHVAIVTKSGTNQFHGSGFYYFGNEALDARDWFGNNRALAKPAHRLNEFGGMVGGPIQRDHWFFFSSYEGFRLRQPVVALTDVPSLTARRAAPLNTQPLLNLYPLPNGTERPDGFAEFASSFANDGRHDTGGFRIDSYLNDKFSVVGRFNFVTSNADERGAGGLSLNTLNHLSNRAQTITGLANYTISATMVAELKGNYSWFTSQSAYALDGFGGALLPASSIFTQPATGDSALFSADLNASSAQLVSGSGVASRQRQFNFLGAVSMVRGGHSLKLGADYRRIFPIIGQRQLEQSALFAGVTQALTGTATRLNLLTRSQTQQPVFNNFSAYGQDEWRVTPRITLTYGLRWELNPAPAPSDKANARAVSQIEDPASLVLASQGTRLWQTTYGNFAPRVSLAYQPLNDDRFIIRSFFGMRYDLGNGAAGDAYADSYPVLNGQSQFNVPFSFVAPASLNPTNVTVPFAALDPNLKLPYLIEWSASVQHQLGRVQSITALYLGNAGKRLLLTDTQLDQNPTFAFLRLTNNKGSSSYHALQLQFERRFSGQLGAMASYTLGKSTDNASQDSAARALFRSVNDTAERGPSDFDVRHTLTGYLSYEPKPLFASGFRNALTRHWTIDSVFRVRSAAPVNVVYGVPTTFGFLYLRPDLIPSAQLYLRDAAVARETRINAAAFSVPQDLRQGTLGRNALRGSPLSQVNLALRRYFKFTDDVKLTIGAEAQNIFNHPNFSPPQGNDASLGTRVAPGTSLQVNPTFGQSYSNAARSNWGIAGSSYGPSYYPGGARTLKLTAKMEF